MAAKKPSKKWKITHITASGPVVTEHRSEPETYRKVAQVQADVQAGLSRVDRMRIERYKTVKHNLGDYGEWELFEIVDIAKTDNV